MRLTRLLTWAALLAALLFAALPTAAAPSLDCPPADPGCLPAPPGSVQVNPNPLTADGQLAEVEAPGVLEPLQAVVPMLAPRVAVEPLASEAAPSFSSLSVPIRYQDPSDVSCGVQALGMALDGLPGAPPTSAALLGFLQGNSMMYDFGTGVEELAFAAQSFGYKGSFAFHGASLDDLAAQLAAGSPVVVSLGANGQGQPGHFVTVTGISPDGRWVSYNDPTLGKVVVSAEEFLRLWGLQGNSGVAVATTKPAAPVDSAPWVMVVAAAAALATTAPPLRSKRLGIGGSLRVAVQASPSVSLTPTFSPSLQIQQGWTTQAVPVYKTHLVQDGWKTIMEPYEVYETVIVQEGWDVWTEEVEFYRTETYVSDRKVVGYKKVPEYMYIRGRKKFVGYDYQPIYQDVYSTRRVKDYRTVTHREPHLVTKQVFIGIEERPVRIPRMVEKQELVGTEEKIVPKLVPASRMWITDEGGMNLRSQPSTSASILGGLEYLDTVYWDGRTHTQGDGMVWYHVSDGALLPDGSPRWGWVAEVGLHATDEVGNPFPDVITTGFGGGADAWSLYTVSGATSPQYMDIHQILVNAGAPDAASYGSHAYVNRCGELALARSLNLPLEQVFREMAEVHGDVLRNDGTTGAGDLIDLYNELGVTAHPELGREAMEDKARAGRTVLALVTVVGGSQFAPSEQEGKLIDHWVQLVDPGDGNLQAYNSLTNTLIDIDAPGLTWQNTGVVVEP